ncbi:MAG: hypothetical protein RSB99_01730 [Bacilli bacterium]
MSSKIINMQYARLLREYILNNKLVLNTKSIFPIMGILSSNQQMIEKSISKLDNSSLSHLGDDRDYLLQGNKELYHIFDIITKNVVESRTNTLNNLTNNKSLREFLDDYNIGDLLPKFLLTSLVVETSELFDFDNPSSRFRNIYLPFSKQELEHPAIILEKIRLSCNHGAINIDKVNPNFNLKSGVLTFYDPYNNYSEKNAYHYTISLKDYLHFLNSAERTYERLDMENKKIKQKVAGRVTK